MSVSRIPGESTTTASIVLTFVSMLSISELLLLVILVGWLIPVSKPRAKIVSKNPEFLGLPKTKCC